MQGEGDIGYSTADDMHADTDPHTLGHWTLISIEIELKIKQFNWNRTIVTELHDHLPTPEGQINFPLFLIFNPIRPGLFGSTGTRGGADLPPPNKNGGNGWGVQKLSWNLISYQDWCQTWGFTIFRNLEPPELMVWKSDFFSRSMRFVRVPPYEIWANWTNFCRSWENGDFLEGQKCCILFHTQNEEKKQSIRYLLSSQPWKKSLFQTVSSGGSWFLKVVNPHVWHQSW